MEIGVAQTVKCLLKASRSRYQHQKHHLICLCSWADDFMLLYISFNFIQICLGGNKNVDARTIKGWSVFGIGCITVIYLSKSHFKMISNVLSVWFDWWSWPVGVSRLILHWTVHLLTSSRRTWTSSLRLEHIWKHPPRCVSESILLCMRSRWPCRRPSACWEWFFRRRSSSSTLPHISQSCPSISTSVTMRLKCSPWSPVRALIFRTSWLKSRTFVIIMKTWILWFCLQTPVTLYENDNMTGGWRQEAITAWDSGSQTEKHTRP